MQKTERRGWVMLEEDARGMLPMIEERIRSSGIEVRHRDALIRLRAMIEEDLEAVRDPSAGGEGIQQAELGIPT